MGYWKTYSAGKHRGGKTGVNYECLRRHFVDDCTSVRLLVFENCFEVVIGILWHPAPDGMSNYDNDQPGSRPFPKDQHLPSGLRRREASCAQDGSRLSGGSLCRALHLTDEFAVCVDYNYLLCNWLVVYPRGLPSDWALRLRSTGPTYMDQLIGSRR